MANLFNQDFQDFIQSLGQFGAPVFPESEFLGNKFNVWGFGKEPTELKL